jgi:meso-butanediol dehydrogenase/(S,S)-butanediol dehydrogenase/diacetyl reductase
MRLQDKVAIVTGGGLGIGRAIAETFAREGARVVVADLNEDAGQETVRHIETLDGAARFVRTDVSKADDAERAVSTCLSRYGRLDILINSAGVYARGDVVSTSLETWQRLLSVNLTGVFLCCKAAIPAIKRGGGGAIINISSSVGWHDTAPGIAAYTASKFGVTGLTKAMACDHLRENIRINCICPGPTDTPLLRASRSPEVLQAFAEAQPIGRLGTPQEIAAAALFLASDEASFVTGVAFPVDGGQTAHI